MVNKRVTKIRIGIMGTPQINHIIPLLRDRYEVIDLESILDSCNTKVQKAIRYIDALRQLDVVYNVFTTGWRKLLLAKMLGKKVITHWIGSDVMFAEEGVTDINKFSFVDKHVVCFEPLKKTLASLNVDAELLPIIPFNMNFEIDDMPRRHAALIYMPTGSEELYGFDVLKRVFETFPDLIFYIAAHTESDYFSDYSNVVSLGRLTLTQMEELYKKISILIRFTKNDGLSMMVLEALAKGKTVIWNYEHPFVNVCVTFEDIVSTLNSVLNEEPKVDVDAHLYILEQYSKIKLLDMYSDCINNMYS